MCRKTVLTYDKIRFVYSAKFTDDRTQNIFPSNFVRTSKYTMVNFLPHSLLAQFKRFANVYFLIITVLSAIPTISPFNPISAILPFAFILLVSMIREGIEDYGRHKSDKEMNQATCLKYKGLKPKKDKWLNLQVGDVVQIEDNQFFPADIVPVTTGIKGGNCFI